MKQRLSPTTIIIITIALAAITAIPAIIAQDARPKPSPGASSAVNEDVMYTRLGQFFKLVSEGKVKNAYETLTKGSKSINDIKPLVTQTEAVIAGNGDIIDAELLRTTRVGKRLIRISYLTHGKVYPMQWNFYCYQSAGGWQVLDITVNNDLYAIFDEEEKAQEKDRAKKSR